VAELAVWAEKYRPERLSEVINQKHVVERVKAFVKDKNIPHMLFAGPAGTGKTTVALAIAHELYGKEWRQNILEKNASVTPDTPIMIRKNGQITRTNFAELDKQYFDKDNRAQRYVRVEDLEILSLNKEGKIEFLPISTISRHSVSKIAEIKYEGGKVKTSLNHSVMIIDKKGNLNSKMVSDLNTGDFLITFKTVLSGFDNEINLEEFKPKLYNELRSGLTKNPKITKRFRNRKLKPSLSWLLGLYLAEGCTSLTNNTQGQTIFTFGYPQENQIAEKVQSFIKINFGLEPSLTPATSGFDREKFSSIQLRIRNTQLAKFFRENFYQEKMPKIAKNKRVPFLIFSSTLNNRISFLKGYLGDATGEWNSYVRYSSRSQDNLIDIAWLGRISGLDTSLFCGESRIVWKRPSFSYIKSEFVPALPFIQFLEKINEKVKFNWRYEFRHQLYHKKSKRITKSLVERIINKIDRKSLTQQENEEFEKLVKLIKSEISVIKIKKIKLKKYDKFVYDVSVPNSEMFWGGTTPILLHNSDERGIDVIRGAVKDFARTKSIGEVPYKIIILDESDALTQEAQQALRRTMENFTTVSRFILICNYSGKIIEPIQSRTAVFRFKTLTEDDIKKFIKRIVEGEKLKITEDAVAAIIYLSEGDLRKVANLLQASAALGEKITESIVYDVSSQAKPADVKEMLEFALNGKFEDARKRLQDMLLRQGLSGEDIIREIHKQIYSLDISEQAKVQLIEKTGEFEYRLSEGSSDLIQLEALLTQFLLFSKKS